MLTKTIRHPSSYLHFFLTWPLSQCTTERDNRDFTIPRSNGNRNVKNNNRFRRRNNNFARKQLCTSLFLTFLCCFWMTATWNCLILIFGEDLNKQQQNFILFLNLNMVLRNSTPGGFAYIWQSYWVGIILKKTERTQIHLWSNVFTAVVSSDRKVAKYPLQASTLTMYRYIFFCGYKIEIMVKFTEVKRDCLIDKPAAYLILSLSFIKKVADTWVFAVIIFHSRHWN